MEALTLAKTETSSITGRLHIKAVLRSKLPPVSVYSIKPGDEVNVFRENTELWQRPYNVHTLRDKQVFLNVGDTIKQLNISQLLPASASARDNELTRLHESIEQFK